MTNQECKLFRVEFGMFKLDGGAMFGSVPKNLWSKLIPVDEQNRIPLAARGLLIQQGSKLILVDVGMGEKWDSKSRDIFAIQNNSFDQIKLDPTKITDVILTHLHFDHAGGISVYDETDSTHTKIKPTYPNAKLFVQRRNLEVAKKPSVREKASYLKENWQVVDQMNVELLDGDTQIYPGIRTHEIFGHTDGQQWIEIESEGRKWLFTTDLIPTSRHLPVPFVMGYDLCAKTVLEEKQAFLEYALKEQAVLIFQHDPDLPAATIQINQKGHFAVKDIVDLPKWGQ
jgi:glyoxylase-like metal-dependent hydrolase (beta-lactamase superfamily II)